MTSPREAAQTIILLREVSEQLAQIQSAMDDMNEQVKVMAPQVHELWNHHKRKIIVNIAGGIQ